MMGAAVPGRRDGRPGRLFPLRSPSGPHRLPLRGGLAGAPRHAGEATGVSGAATPPQSPRAGPASQLPAKAPWQPPRQPRAEDPDGRARACSYACAVALLVNPGKAAASWLGLRPLRSPGPTAPMTRGCLRCGRWGSEPNVCLEGRRKAKSWCRQGEASFPCPSAHARARDSPAPAQRGRDPVVCKARVCKICFLAAVGFLASGSCP